VPCPWALTSLDGWRVILLNSFHRAIPLDRRRLADLAGVRPCQRLTRNAALPPLPFSSISSTPTLAEEADRDKGEACNERDGGASIGHDESRAGTQHRSSEWNQRNRSSSSVRGELWHVRNAPAGRDGTSDFGRFAFTPIRRQVPKRPEEAAVLRKVDTKRLLVTQDVENALKVAETGDAGLA
jgi:hypothetical protein